MAILEPAYLINDNSVVVVMDGKQYTASKSSHDTFDKILEAIKTKRWSDLPKLFDIKVAITQFTNDLVKIVDGVLYFKDSPLHNSLTKRILEMFRGGYDIKPMSRFLINLMNNPSKTATDELYLFLETGNMPITEDGHFLAYKKVGSNFKDLYTGTMDNSVGKTVEVPRNSVDDNRNNTCSYGLHFCSVDYLAHYGVSPSNNVVIVKINPADVVSIPSDYKNTKGRCSKYLVVGEYKDYGKSTQDIFSKPVYTKEDIWDNWNYSDESDTMTDTQIENKISALNIERDDLENTLYDLDNEINDINFQIEKLEDAIEAISTQSLIDSVDHEIELLKDRENNLIGEMDLLESRIEEIIVEIDELESKF